jgi:hypothetical protein
MHEAFATGVSWALQGGRFLRTTSQTNETPPLAHDFPEESEVELLSPYVVDSLAPTKLVLPVSTRVKRAPPVRRHEGLRALAIVAGGLVVVALGLLAGMAVVLASGIR